LPTDKELVLKVIPMPADCNANGDIFGGWVMAQVDLAGSVLPGALYAGPHGDRGGQPVHLQAAGAGGRHPELFCLVTRIGRTSITVQVEVFAEGFRTQGTVRQGDRGVADLCGD
jgi:acyl-CoA thioesterase YciA